MPIFVLDSNFFIQAHRLYYPIDVAAGFWNKVRQLSIKGRLVSIDKVKNELYDKNDELEKWCRNNLPDDFFKDTTVVMVAYAEVINWAISKSSHYAPNAIKEFLDADEADAFLVDYCLTDQKNRFVVTQELSEPNRKNKVKIPECCKPLNVEFFSTIGMFRHLRETF
jgi:hypothetical protein